MELMIPETYLNVYIGFLRYAAPILVILLLFLTYLFKLKKVKFLVF